jgi:hypothetical protein
MRRSFSLARAPQADHEHVIGCSHSGKNACLFGIDATSIHGRDGTHSYTWDARDHLKQIDSGSTASFVYDPVGRRTSKTDRPDLLVQEK